MEKSIEAAKIKADQMFFEVLGRKDRADATRNALNVMNRFKFLFYLPANIEANIVKGMFFFFMIFMINLYPIDRLPFVNSAISTF